MALERIEIELVLVGSTADAPLIGHALVNMVARVASLLHHVAVVQAVVYELGRVVPHLAILLVLSSAPAALGSGDVHRVALGLSGSLGRATCLVRVGSYVAVHDLGVVPSRLGPALDLVLDLLFLVGVTDRDALADLLLLGTV